MYQYLPTPKTFMIEDRLRVSNFLQNTKCQKCKDAVHFGRPEIFDSGFLFEKHSPLREVFKNGLVHMRETGGIDKIKRSLGPDFIPQPHQSKSPLTIQLMAMLLIFMGLAAFVMCPAVLAMEYLWKWLIPRLQDIPGNPGLYNCERIYEEGICEQCGLKQIRQKICIK